MRADVQALGKLLHSREVHVQVSAGLRRVEDSTDCGKELAERLHLFLFWVVDVAEQLLHTLVHDTLREHLQLE